MIFARVGRFATGLKIEQRPTTLFYNDFLGLGIFCLVVELHYGGFSSNAMQWVWSVKYL